MMVKALPILIVDENQQMMTMLRRFLARQGLGVHTVTGVAAARTLIVQQPFHVVLTDLFWPSEDGLRLVRYVRKMTPHARVIVMTAFPDHAAHRLAFAAGADVCLDKPFRLRQLWDAVRQQKFLQSDPPDRYELLT